MSQPSGNGTVQREITGVANFPKVGTLPRGRTLTGTFSSVGVVVTGTGTLFSTELAGIRGWLYSTSNNELRSFFGYHDNTTLQLHTAFTSNQVNQPVIVCTPLYKSVAASNTGTGSAKLKEKVFTAGKIVSYNDDACVNPMTYEASAASASIEFELIF